MRALLDASPAQAARPAYFSTFRTGRGGGRSHALPKPFRAPPARRRGKPALSPGGCPDSLMEPPYTPPSSEGRRGAFPRSAPRGERDTAEESLRPAPKGNSSCSLWDRWGEKARACCTGAPPVAPRENKVGVSRLPNSRIHRVRPDFVSTVSKLIAFAHMVRKQLEDWVLLGQ